MTSLKGNWNFFYSVLIGITVMAVFITWIRVSYIADEVAAIKHIVTEMKTLLEQNSLEKLLEMKEKLKGH